MKNLLEPFAKPLLLDLQKKDTYTFYHSKNVALMCARTARALGLDMQGQQDVFVSAYLHDIGKIDIGSDLLKKDGVLSEDEIVSIRRHSVLGEKMLLPYDARTADIIRHHHEKVDGSGYPDGLSGDKIPLESRIIAVADAYDAITTRSQPIVRSRTDAIREIKRNIGSQFDSEIANEFLTII